ncbi:ATP-binding protein [Rhizobium sp. Pop5]|uniref:ATP-binding protein n=1 Tax=Rhizobium sp. Pop5 TaxID=1223565 RepID=UPI0006896E85|nr:ATP-binding protein [Rhizobium sp. Pop5]UVD57301.1 ATP-binding protein [Rhizobium sp. Pop5]
MATSVKSSLNKQIVWSMTIVAFVAAGIMFFGFLAYVSVLDWFFPNAEDSTDWTPTDFVVLGLMIAIGQAVAAYVGWRLSRRLVVPLTAVTEAARSIAAGDFAGRAQTAGSFGEVDRLIRDFNQMAEQLQRAEQELQYSNSAIAHELRTPLTILRGRMQGLADGVFEPSPALFQSLIGQIESLTRIVDDLKTLSLMNAGRMELQLTEFELASEVEDVLDSVRPSLSNAGITVTSDTQTIWVRADRTRVRQVVLALLDNARRYAPGSVVVLQTYEKQGNWIVSVSDSGAGMTDAEFEKAFERFWRAESARTRSSGGSGLGLAVVKAIAEAHGGGATIARSETGGLAVKLSLPAA